MWRPPLRRALIQTPARGPGPAAARGQRPAPRETRAQGPAGIGAAAWGGPAPSPRSRADPVRPGPARPSAAKAEPSRPKPFLQRPRCPPPGGAGPGRCNPAPRAHPRGAGPLRRSAPRRRHVGSWCGADCVSGRRGRAKGRVESSRAGPDRAGLAAAPRRKRARGRWPHSGLLVLEAALGRQEAPAPLLSLPVPPWRHLWRRGAGLGQKRLPCPARQHGHP